MLGNPLNGDVITNGTTLGSTASYMCGEGYLLVGNSVRMCQTNGTWTNSEPSCEGKQLSTLLQCRLTQVRMYTHWHSNYESAV